MPDDAHRLDKTKFLYVGAGLFSVSAPSSACNIGCVSSAAVLLASRCVLQSSPCASAGGDDMPVPPVCHQNAANGADGLATRAISEHLSPLHPNFLRTYAPPMCVF